MSEFIRQLCKKSNINLITVPAGRLNHDNENSQQDLARDLDHYGPLEQNYTYKYALYKIKNERYS